MWTPFDPSIMSLGIEAMSKRMCDTLNSITETSYFLQDMGLKEIGVVIDNYHMVENDEQIDDLLKVHLISHVRISNPFDREPPKDSDPYDYRKLFTQLSNCNYNDRVSIECNAINNPLASRSAVDFLKNI